MIDFHAPSTEDLVQANACLNEAGRRACEYSFTNLMCWGISYHQQIALHDGFLLARFQLSNGPAYLYPAGTGDEKAVIEKLMADSHAHGIKLRLAAATPEDIARVNEWFPGRFRSFSDPANSDYCYDVEKMCTLAGKKLHGKRNHIHRFDERFPDWMFEPIGRDNLQECLELENRWAADRHGDEPGADILHEETVAVIEALYQMEALGLEGGLIRAEGSVIAFSLASRTTEDCFDVHFEKACGDIQGAYPVINREMARMLRANHPEVRWLNREDDLGLEGLRKAKLSYYPDILLEKFIAREVE
jgi:hypothetical protein